MKPLPPAVLARIQPAQLSLLVLVPFGILPAWNNANAQIGRPLTTDEMLVVMVETCPSPCTDSGYAVHSINATDGTLTIIAGCYGVDSGDHGGCDGSTFGTIDQFAGTLHGFFVHEVRATSDPSRALISAKIRGEATEGDPPTEIVGIWEIDVPTGNLSLVREITAADFGSAFPPDRLAFDVVPPPSVATAAVPLFNSWGWIIAAAILIGYRGAVVPRSRRSESS